jgi:hypothetical protein
MEFSGGLDHKREEPDPSGAAPRGQDPPRSRTRDQGGKRRGAWRITHIVPLHPLPLLIVVHRIRSR